MLFKVYGDVVEDCEIMVDWDEGRKGVKLVIKFIVYLVKIIKIGGRCIYVVVVNCFSVIIFLNCYKYYIFLNND